MTFGVAPEYRKLGLGGTLLEVRHPTLNTFAVWLTPCLHLKLILHQLCDAGMKHIVLHVLKTNTAAIRFYMKKGFSITRHLPRFYTIKNHRHDAYQMEWDVGDNSSKWKGGDNLIGVEGGGNSLIGGETADIFSEGKPLLFLFLAVLFVVAIVLLGAYLNSLPPTPSFALPRRDPR